MSDTNALRTAVLSSLIASVVFAAIGLCLRWFRNRYRARSIVGVYEMLDADQRLRGGKVTIERDPITLFLNSAPVLTIFAEHDTGAEDWEGEIELSGFSRSTATGFYWYLNRSGGGLRLRLSAAGDTITEYGFTRLPSMDSQTMARIGPSCECVVEFRRL